MPRCRVGDFIGVRDDNERHTVRFLNTGEHLHNVCGIHAVEISGRLISQQDGRVIGQRSRNRDALALTGRKLVRVPVHALFEAHFAQQSFGPLHAAVAAMTYAKQRRLHIFNCAQGGQQVKRLENKPDMMAAIGVEVDGRS